mmetsp:Transcript_20515/g.46549  ORF Transcript_20515/g.46549 Transcript_20515/m.46549 type:complete len:102 (-) Transcript_20515:442-747(-)
MAWSPSFLAKKAPAAALEMILVHASSSPFRNTFTATPKPPKAAEILPKFLAQDIDRVFIRVNLLDISETKGWCTPFSIGRKTNPGEPNIVPKSNPCKYPEQ